MKTTIEQSRHLAELGVDFKTADLTYERIAIGGNGYNEFPEKFQYRLLDMHFQYFSGIGVPCWSLEALFELMPEELDGSCGLSIYYKGDDEWMVCYEDGLGHVYGHEETSCDIVLAAYRMVVWLIENGFIKTEKEKKQ